MGNERVIRVTLKSFILSLSLGPGHTDRCGLLEGLDHEAAARVAAFPNQAARLLLDGVQIAGGYRLLDVPGVPERAASAPDV